MSEIQVNTSDLKNGSQNLKSASDEIRSAQSHVSNAPLSVGNAYDGQLKQALEGIIGGASQTGTRLQSRALDLGDELLIRATGFETANETGRSAVLGASTTYIDFIQTTPRLGFITFLIKFRGIASSIWTMGGLAIGGLASLIFVSTKPGIPTPVHSPTSTPKENFISNNIANKSPVQGVKPIVTQKIHYSGDSKDGKRGVAIDIGTSDSDKAEIHNIVAGKIIGTGPMIDKDGKLYDYGNYVKVLQDDGVVVLYAHLKEQPANIKIGNRLESSQHIGMMGSTGRSTGPHLHLEFREPKFDKNGNYAGDTTGLVENKFDPFEYLKGKGVEF